MNKMPRNYAADYLSAGGDKAKQKQAVAGCPPDWRELVRTHVKTFKERKRS